MAYYVVKDGQGDKKSDIFKSQNESDSLRGVKRDVWYRVDIINKSSGTLNWLDVAGYPSHLAHIESRTGWRFITHKDVSDPHRHNLAYLLYPDLELWGQTNQNKSERGH